MGMQQATQTEDLHTLEGGSRDATARHKKREEATHLGRCSWDTGFRSSRSLGPRSRTKSIHFGDETRSFCLPGMSGGGEPSGGSVGSTQLMEASSILRAQTSKNSKIPSYVCVHGRSKSENHQGLRSECVCCSKRQRRAARTVD